MSVSPPTQMGTNLFEIIRLYQTDPSFCMELMEDAARAIASRGLDCETAGVPGMTLSVLFGSMSPSAIKQKMDALQSSLHPESSTPNYPNTPLPQVLVVGCGDAVFGVSVGAVGNVAVGGQYAGVASSQGGYAENIPVMLTDNYNATDVHHLFTELNISPNREAAFLKRVAIEALASNRQVARVTLLGHTLDIDVDGDQGSVTITGARRVKANVNV